MALNLDSKSTHYLEELHGFIDWINRWGQPRTQHEEVTFYDIQGKIIEGELTLKPFVHRLRSSLERFLDDYRMEPHGQERIGKDFLEKASQFLEQAQSFTNQASEEDKPLNAEIIKLIQAGIANVK